MRFALLPITVFSVVATASPVNENAWKWEPKIPSQITTKSPRKNRTLKAIKTAFNEIRNLPRKTAPSLQELLN